MEPISSHLPHIKSRELLNGHFFVDIDDHVGENETILESLRALNKLNEKSEELGVNTKQPKSENYA